MQNDKETVTRHYIVDYLSIANRDIFVTEDGSYTTRYVYDVSGRRISAEFDYAPGTKRGEAGENLQSDISVSIGKVFYRTSILGSTLFAVDKDGNQIAHAIYDPWGKPLTETYTDANYSGLENLNNYTGYTWDITLALYFAQNRFYDADTHRFTQEDAVKDGTNWYVYCGNSPALRVDLFGTYTKYIKIDGRIVELKDTSYISIGFVQLRELIDIINKYVSSATVSYNSLTHVVSGKVNGRYYTFDLDDFQITNNRNEKNGLGYFALNDLKYYFAVLYCKETWKNYVSLYSFVLAAGLTSSISWCGNNDNKNIENMKKFFGVSSTSDIPAFADNQMVFIENINSFGFAIEGHTVVMNNDKYCEYTFAGFGVSISGFMHAELTGDIAVTAGYVYNVYSPSDYSGLFFGLSATLPGYASGGAGALNGVYAKILGGTSQLAGSAGVSITSYIQVQNDWVYGEAPIIWYYSSYPTSSVYNGDDSVAI